MEKIYEQEVLSLSKDGAYCSMWQVYQAANIIGRPILSIFPSTGMTEEYRSRTNRIVYPIKFHQRDRDPVIIMWTKSHSNVVTPNHFVAVVKFM